MVLLVAWKMKRLLRFSSLSSCFRVLIVIAETVAYFETTFEQLSAIAPTIVLDGDPYSYSEKAVLDLAGVFGLEAQASENLARYNEEMQTECARIRGVVGDKTLAVIDIYPDSAYLIAPGYGSEENYAPGSIAKYYGTCGLNPFPELRELVSLDSGSVNLSLELLGSVTADYRLVYASSEEQFEVWQDREIWQLLPAVRSGRVFEASPAVWGFFGDLESLKFFAVSLEGVVP